MSTVGTTSTQNLEPVATDLDDSHFQLPIRQQLVSVSDAGKDNIVILNDVPRKRGASIRDDESTGSWEDIPTPEDESIQPTATIETSSDKAEPAAKGKPPSFIDVDEYDAFYEAIINGDLDVIKERLDSGADIERENDDGFSPLLLALISHKVEAIQLLLERGAATYHRVGDMLPIVVALQKPETTTQVVKLLLDHGADPSSPSGPEDMNALHWAVSLNLLEIADLIASTGMDLNSIRSFGQTPLIIAAEKGHTLIAKTLVAKGADMLKGSANGGTALAWAARGGHLECVKYFLSEGMDIDNCDSYGFSERIPF